MGIDYTTILADPAWRSRGICRIFSPKVERASELRCSDSPSFPKLSAANSGGVLGWFQGLGDRGVSPRSTYACDSKTGAEAICLNLLAAFYLRPVRNQARTPPKFFVNSSLSESFGNGRFRPASMRCVSTRIVGRPKSAMLSRGHLIGQVGDAGARCNPFS
jgi:hypothetical protein